MFSPVFLWNWSKAFLASLERKQGKSIYFYHYSFNAGKNIVKVNYNKNRCNDRYVM